MNRVIAGASFDFTIDAGDDDAGMTLDIAMMKYPGDTPTVSRTITQVDGKWPITLTSAETAAAGYGQWAIHTHISDASEDIRETVKLYISKAWI